MNLFRLLAACTCGAVLVGCSANSNELQSSHLKAKADLTAALSGNLPVGKRLHITYYGRSVETVPPTCVGAQLLPIDVHPEKGRYTYLVWCEKRPVSVVRIERADGVDDVALIFMDVKSHCDQRPKKCEAAALDNIDKPVVNIDGVTQ